MPAVKSGPNDVFSYLLLRSGLLRQPTEGRIDFIHKTFQEYLVAKETVEQGNLPFLVNQAEQDKWSEAIVLTAGLARLTERESFLSGLLDRGYAEQDNRHRLHLLAIACLETCAELSPDLTGKLKSCLGELVPPKSMTEARALASAGELATGVLIGHPRSAATATAACIRALALIGTEHAVDGIATYAKDSRLTVIKELVRAWSYFVTEEYARRVLSQSPLDDGTLRIRDPAVIEAAKTLNNAVSIHISVPGKLRTLDTVTDMANLEVLDVTGSPGIVDLSPLETTGRLRQLWLYGCRAITDLTPLASLEHLTVVSAAYTSVSELEPLRDLPKLRARDFGRDPC